MTLEISCVILHSCAGILGRCRFNGGCLQGIGVPSAQPRFLLASERTERKRRPMGMVGMTFPFRRRPCQVCTSRTVGDSFSRCLSSRKASVCQGKAVWDIIRLTPENEREKKGRRWLLLNTRYILIQQDDRKITFRTRYTPLYHKTREKVPQFDFGVLPKQKWRSLLCRSCHAPARCMPMILISHESVSLSQFHS